MGGKQQLAAVAGQGTELPQLEFGAAAERLLAAPRQLLHAMGLQERSKRWFGQRSGTVRCTESPGWVPAVAQPLGGLCWCSDCRCFMRRHSLTHPVRFVKLKLQEGAESAADS